jgi:hypothetical protein
MAWARDMLAGTNKLVCRKHRTMSTQIRPRTWVELEEMIKKRNSKPNKQTKKDYLLVEKSKPTQNHQGYIAAQ